MTAKIRLASSWLPTAALTSAGFFCGIAASALFLMGVESRQIESLRNELITARAQADSLEQASKSVGLALSVSTAALGYTEAPAKAETDAPAAPVAAQALPPVQEERPQRTPVPAAPQPTKASAKAAAPPKAAPQPKPTKPAQEPAPKTAKPPPQEPPRQAAKPANEARPGPMELPLPSATPSRAQAAATPTKPADEPKPVSEIDLKSALEKNTIEMAPKAKMGVAKIESGRVVMGSGVQVRVGNRFTSGERLLSADPETGRIVTDRRTVVIMN